MTALVARRQHNLRTAGAIGAVSVLLTVLAIVIGVSALANSDAGRDVTGAGTPDRLRFPVTPTAAIAVLDGEDELVSIGVFVLHPDGIGGSLVVIPGRAEAVPGVLGDSTPVSLASQWAQGGQERFELHLEAVSAVSLDMVEMVPIADLPDLLNVGDLIAWELDPSLEADTLVALMESGILGGSVVPGLGRELNHQEFMALMTWEGPTDLIAAGVLARDLEKIRVSLWSALLGAMPVGAVPSQADQAGELAPVPGDLIEFLELLTAGGVGVRGLMVTRTSDPEVIALDRAEIVLIFGQIAPARLAAPNESSRFRVVAQFAPDQLSQIGQSQADLARDLISHLLFLDANVVSVQAVDPTSSEVRAPEVTVLQVADARQLTAMAEQWSRVFGDIKIEVAEVAIEGVDATIIIGTNYESFQK
jgi:hypothetical protein